MNIPHFISSAMDVDIWAISRFGLLTHDIVMNVPYKSFGEYVYSVLLHIVEVDLLHQRVS